MNTAIAIAAHPDDIEFMMAGTLLLLGQAGWRIHYLNLASGNCGSQEHPAGTTRRMRRAEAKSAARMLGATWHPPWCDDLEILYEPGNLRRLAAIIREVKPAVVLTHSPQDYMEDHTNTARLAVTAAFARGMPNYQTIPRRQPVDNNVTIYHAMPHGLRDGLRRKIVPGLFVNTAAVQEAKRKALASHGSQQAWLEVSQGLNSYLETMDAMSRAVAKLSRRFTHAEGWRRHSHLGFCEDTTDPLRTALGKNCRLNPRYEASLEAGNCPMVPSSRCAKI